MKQFLTLSIFFVFLFNLQNVNGQFITISPNSSDFCFPINVTYTAPNPAPGNTIQWWIEDYNNFANSGQPLVWMIGTGPSIQIFSGSFGNGAAVLHREVDANGNVVFGSSSAQLYKDINPSSIPIVTTHQFGSCWSLMIPPIFDPLSVLPWGQTRWAMWYKNGIPLGVNSYALQGPLTDSAWYQFKTVLTCGDTMSTAPYYFWNPSIPTISTSNPTIICQGDSVTLNASQSLTITGWSKDGVIIPGSNALSSIKATLSGNYKVHVRYSTGGGGYCYLESDPILVTVQAGAFITSLKNEACNGDSIQLTCTAANSYVWKRNGNLMNGANTQSIWIKTSGQYEVSTTGLTCNTSFIKSITFYANASVIVAPSVNQDLCAGSVTILNASGSNIFSYQWYQYNSLLDGANTDELALTKPGKYSCVVTNAIGCSKTSNKVVVNKISSGSLPTKRVVINGGKDGYDSYVSSAFGNFGSNYGTAPTLEISNWYKYFRTEERGYLGFDMSAIPLNSPIVTATLKLYVDTIDSLNTSYGPNSLYLERATSLWYENSISYNFQPSINGFQNTVIPCSTISSKSWLNANVINQVKHWSYLPSENFGLYIHFNDMKELTWARILSTNNPDYGHRPKLIVRYNYADINPSGPLYFCTGGAVTFTTNVGAYMYQWYKNNSPIAGATSSSYTATTSGDYYVVLTVASGCSVQSITQTVGANIPTPVDIQGDGSFDFCKGSTLTLSVDSVQGHQFQWKKNNVNIQGAIYSQLAVTQAGTYVVRVTNTCGLISRDTVICTEVNNPSPSITANGPLTFCAGQGVTFTAAVYSGVVNQWRKNNIDIAGAVGSIYYATQSGSYSVKQTANGCSKYSANKVVNVNCREGEFVAENYSIEIFPQPINSGATIVVRGDVDFAAIHFQLFDLSGKRIQQFNADGITTPFYKGKLRAGMYLLKTTYNDQHIGINKMLIVD